MSRIDTIGQNGNEGLHYEPPAAWVQRELDQRYAGAYPQRAAEPEAPEPEGDELMGC